MHVFRKRLLFLLVAVLVLLLASFTYHRLGLQREKASLSPLGRMVAVNEHKMSVFVRGQERPLPFYILKTCMMGFLSSIR